MSTRPPTRLAALPLLREFFGGSAPGHLPLVLRCHGDGFPISSATLRFAVSSFLHSPH